MSINSISLPEVNALSGLSTDAKPVDVFISTQFYETDTGKKYEFYGAAGWVEVGVKSTGGAASVQTSAGSLTAYGAQPENRYLAATATNASAADNAAFNTQTAVGMYEAVVFDTTTGEVSAQLSINGGATFADTTVNNLFVDLGTPATTVTDSYKGFKLVATTTGGVGPYLLLLPCNSFRFTNDGATPAVVNFSLLGKNPL